MGADKLVADLAGRPVLAHVLDAFAMAGIPTLCVVGEEEGKAANVAKTSSIPLVVAGNHALGMAHSLRAGLSACPIGWDAVIVALADMPLVSPALLFEIAAAADHDHIVVPVCGEERGNPVAWGRDFIPALSKLSGDRGGRSLMPRFAGAIREVPWHDLSEIRLDVDDPAALETAREIVQRRARQRSEQ
jgi:molybdenum cofactor cytidylyltransferase